MDSRKIKISKYLVLSSFLFGSFSGIGASLEAAAFSDDEQKWPTEKEWAVTSDWLKDQGISRRDFRRFVTPGLQTKLEEERKEAGKEAYNKLAHRIGKNIENLEAAKKQASDEEATARRELNDVVQKIPQQDKPNETDITNLAGAIRKLKVCIRIVEGIEAACTGPASPADSVSPEPPARSRPLESQTRAPDLPWRLPAQGTASARPRSPESHPPIGLTRFGLDPSHSRPEGPGRQNQNTAGDNDEIDQLRAANIAKRAQIIELQNQQRSKNEENAVKIAQLQAAIETRNSKITELRNRLKAANDQLIAEENGDNAEIARLNTQIARLQAANDTNDANVAQITQLNTAANDANAAQIAQLRAANNRLRDRLQAANDQLQAMQAENAQRHIGFWTKLRGFFTRSQNSPEQPPHLSESDSEN